jgi:Synaptotagmin-like mitochondrial-lipid-binding domain
MSTKTRMSWDTHTHTHNGPCARLRAESPDPGEEGAFQFKGKLRVVLKPLIPRPPLAGSVAAYFLDSPSIDFNLTGMGELVELPGLM